jgi:hypothetical protein
LDGEEKMKTDDSDLDIIDSDPVENTDENTEVIDIETDLTLKDIFIGEDE